MKRKYVAAIAPSFIACSSLLAACAAGSLGTRPGLSGNQSCVSEQSVSLVDSVTGGSVAAAQAPAPQPIGGVLTIDSLAPRSTEIVSTVRSNFSELKFGGSASCSAAFEFRKADSRYFVDALLNAYCYVPKLLYKGRNPTLMVYRGAGSGLSSGYESLRVELSEVSERDRILKTLEAIPTSNDDVRSLFVDNSFASERLLAVRAILSELPAGSQDVGLNGALCAAVPEAEISLFDSNPNAKPEDDPRISGKPRPMDCQMMLPSRWVTFSVPAEVAAQKRTVLDSLVQESDRNRSLVASNQNLGAEFPNVMAELRRLDAEAYEADIRRQRLLLAFISIRGANGGCAVADPFATQQNKILAGPSRNAYIDLAKTLVAADMHPLIDKLRAHQCTEDADSAAYRSKLAEASAASDAKFLELARVLGRLQSLMKAKKEQVGIATNHIRNLTGSEVAIEFKDLPLFPAGASVATELQRHTFNFDNPWLSATFDRTKAHPGANNLRTDFNDGYAITFGGVPVGAVSAMTDESGGVAAIPLPERKPVTANAPSSDPNGKTAPGDAERNRADQKSVPVADCK
jgi:hypothetical protein